MTDDKNILHPDCDHLIDYFQLSPTFCEDLALLSVMLIVLKELTCLHHSIEGQMSKLVDSNDGIITAYLREAQPGRNMTS